MLEGKNKSACEERRQKCRREEDRNIGREKIGGYAGRMIVDKKMAWLGRWGPL